MISKALKGMATVNLRSLRFSCDPRHFSSYLHELDGLHQTHTMAPLQPKSLAEIVGPDYFEPIFLPVGRVHSGASPLQDLVALAAMVRTKRPRRIFEIGTFEGLTSVLFVKNSDPGVRVSSLDLPHEKELPRTDRSYSAHSITWSYESGQLIDTYGVRSQVETLFGDSALFDFKPYEGQIDFFFVDGAHSEDYVLSDSCRAFECMTPDGWVAWHDCFNPHVLRALKQVARWVPILQLSGTNLALTMGKPNTDSLRQHLGTEIR